MSGFTSQQLNSVKSISYFVETELAQILDAAIKDNNQSLVEEIRKAILALKDICDTLRIAAMEK